MGVRANKLLTTDSPASPSTAYVEPRSKAQFTIKNKKKKKT